MWVAIVGITVTNHNYVARSSQNTAVICKNVSDGNHFEMYQV